MSELCLLNKEVSGFLPVLCDCVNPYLSGFVQHLVFLGTQPGLPRGKFRFSVSCWVRTGRVCCLV